MKSGDLALLAATLIAFATSVYLWFGGQREEAVRRDLGSLDSGVRHLRRDRDGEAMMETTTIFAIGVVTAALLAVFTVETVVLLRRSGEPQQAEGTPRTAGPADRLPEGRPWARPMRVLLATDGSRCSDAAIRSVAARSWPGGSDVEVVTVVHTRVPNIPEITLMGAAAHVQALEEDREKAPGRIDAALKLLAARPGLAIHSTILEGDPATAILDQARRENADLIVIGSHEYGPVKKMALGSVSQAVATQADCSVEIVRCPHTDA